MDGYDKIMHHAGKYIFPGIFTIAGLTMLILGLTVNKDTGVQQTPEFVYAGLALFLMGILMVLHVLGIFKRKSRFILIPVLVSVCIWFGYMNYASIQARIELEEEYLLYNKYVKQSLIDIRDVQVAFKKTYQRYSDNIGELENFLKTGSVSYVSAKCDNRLIPDERMNMEQAALLGIDPNTDEGNREMEKIDEDEATILGLITRDTVQIPAVDYIFNGYKICDCNVDGKEYEVRVPPMHTAEKRHFPFDLEKIWTKRSKEGQFIVQATDIGDSSHPKPVFKVYDPKPFDPFMRRDTLVVGNLTKHHTEGNWKD